MTPPLVLLILVLGKGRGDVLDKSTCILPICFRLLPGVLLADLVVSNLDGVVWLIDTDRTFPARTRIGVLSFVVPGDFDSVGTKDLVGVVCDMLRFREVSSALNGGGLDPPIPYKLAAANASIGGEEFFGSFLRMGRGAGEDAASAAVIEVEEFEPSFFTVAAVKVVVVALDVAAVVVVVVVDVTAWVAVVMAPEEGVLVLARRPFLFTSASSGFTSSVSLPLQLTVVTVLMALLLLLSLSSPPLLLLLFLLLSFLSTLSLLVCGSEMEPYPSKILSLSATFFPPSPTTLEFS